MTEQLYTVFFHTPLRIVVGAASGPDARAVLHRLVEEGSNHFLRRLCLAFPKLWPVLGFIVEDHVNGKLVGYRLKWVGTRDLPAVSIEGERP